jgi:hypothetical protein
MVSAKFIDNSYLQPAYNIIIAFNTLVFWIYRIHRTNCHSKVIDRLFEYQDIESDYYHSDGSTFSFILLTIIIASCSVTGYIFLIKSGVIIINSTLVFIVLFNLSLLLIVSVRILIDTFLKIKPKSNGRTCHEKIR